MLTQRDPSPANENLPAYVLTAWRSRYTPEGTDLEARAIIDREAAQANA